MHKLGFSGLKSLDQFKSLSGSIPGTAKTFSVPGRPSSDSITLGSFANLKLTAGLRFSRCSFYFLFVFSMENFEPLLIKLLIHPFSEKLVKEQASVKTDLEMAVY